jgi:uncharacterized membrane protein
MIRTPPQWGADVVARAYNAIALSSRDRALQLAVGHAPLAVRKIGFADIRYALGRGVEDFAASRTDVIFLCVLYPLVGLLMARLASGYQLLPLLFPLASGFALVGPLAGVGLNEISRRREKGLKAGWFDAFGVFGSPSILAILMLGAVLLGMLLVWLVLSQAVYILTLGPQPPASLGDFGQSLLYTQAGHTLVFVGVGIGFVFAMVALAISVVSFPLLLDRTVSLETAVRTSLEVVRRNPVTIATWGLVIAAGLVLGSIPLLLGLIVVMPVLGHASWHLYRRAVPAI